MSPLGKVPAVEELSSVYLYAVVSLLASTASVTDLLSAPMWVVYGFFILVVHVIGMYILSKLFHWDLCMVSTASLANIGGRLPHPSWLRLQRILRRHRGPDGGPGGSRRELRRTDLRIYFENDGVTGIMRGRHGGAALSLFLSTVNGPLTVDVDGAVAQCNSPLYNPKEHRNMDKRTLYITGEARTNMDNAITKIYGVFYMAFEVVEQTGEIVEVDCNATLELTRNFIRKLFLNHSILSESQFLEQEVSQRYYGSSGKAILAAYRDARQHYRQIVGQ